MHIQAKLGQDSVLRMVRWHCPPDTGFEIQTLAVWGQARHLSVTEAPHNTSGWGRNIFVSFKPPRPGNEPRERQRCTTTLGLPPMMRVRFTGRYRVLWGARYWNPYPTLTMDPNSHPDHKTNQPNNQPTNNLANQPSIQPISQPTNQPINYPTS